LVQNLNTVDTSHHEQALDRRQEATPEIDSANSAHIRVKVKVKRTLVQALRLCTGRTAHRGSRGVALPFHDHGTRRG
jgi:hypothetical protein